MQRDDGRPCPICKSTIWTDETEPIRIRPECPNGHGEMRILDSEHHATGRLLAVVECQTCKTRKDLTIEVGTGVIDDE